MSFILAARFDTEIEARDALARLAASGFADDATTLFYVTPPGQHGYYPIGGDAHHDEGTRESGKGAAQGAATGAAVGAGIAAATVLAPPVGAAAAIASVGAGAYIGAWAGAMRKAREGDPAHASTEEPVERRSGDMVAVRVDREADFERARRALLDAGAHDLEAAEGTLANGDWVDFDPRLPPHLITEAEVPHGHA